jgi:antitoxin HigA-1
MARSKNDATQNAAHRSLHPGFIISEICLPHVLKSNPTLSCAKIAEKLGISLTIFKSILAGRSAVTPMLAARLPDIFGSTPEFWLRFQSTYDLRRTE